ncbi:DinB family protein [Paenibacillus sp. HJGM_3]|uniref:DinB family protein n=1 Tax=Paenibacillus sp. HJGM_3 TaxID=3379816 RepID=UPI0038586C6E
MSDTATRSIAEYKDTLRRIRESIEGLTDEQLSWKPSPERWSVKQVVAHLVDSSFVHAVRIRKIVAEPNPALPVYDQDAWVESSRANSADIEAILRAYEAILHYNALYFERLVEEDGGRTGDNNGKPVTVDELFQGFIRHVAVHLAQIERTKAAQAASVR